MATNHQQHISCERSLIPNSVEFPPLEPYVATRINDITTNHQQQINRERSSILNSIEFPPPVPYVATRINEIPTNHQQQISSDRDIMLNRPEFLPLVPLVTTRENALATNHQQQTTSDRELILNSEEFSPLVPRVTRRKKGILTSRNLNTDDHVEVDEVVDIDDYMDSRIACDIYEHLLSSEIAKMPSIDFIERIQNDMNATTRGILIDSLVKIAEKHSFVPETLYLTINYMDRYLSINPVNEQHLALLGVVCLMIAAKYEEVEVRSIKTFCGIYIDMYKRDLKEKELLEMEAKVLTSLNFELTVPTTKCFLRRFVRAAQQTSKVPSTLLESMSNYIAELSLLDYNMLQFIPSLIAASSVFLAKYILTPTQKPWNLTLLYYSRYDSPDFHDCVTALHQLCLNTILPTIKEKYSRHKYKSVATIHCPLSIPSNYFHPTNNRSFLHRRRVNHVLN